MKEQDIKRFAAIVREYHRNDPAKRTQSYRDACDTLQDEIGEERMQKAREEYHEKQFRKAEAAEARWIERHR